MKSTLYLKFIILYIIYGFLAIFVALLIGNQSFFDRIEKETSEKLYSEATLFASDYLPAYFNGTVTEQSLAIQLESLQCILDCSVWLVDSQGVMLASAPLPNTTVPLKIDNFNPAENGSNPYMIGTYHQYFDEEVMTVIAPVIQGLSTRSYIILHTPLSFLRQKRDNSMQTLGIVVLVVYLLALVFLLGFYFVIYRRLRQLSEAAKQYASGNLDYEIPVSSQDELGYLAASLNYMSSQLQDMEDYQKKIVGNVSHDFRSPLTSIKGYIQAMADGTIPPELHEKYLNIILFETERLTDLTKDLLTLNELDTKERMLAKTHFDIQEMIKRTIAAFEGICSSRHISMQLLLLPGIITVYADSGKIQQVLYNLIDNAIKFSEYESSITLEVRTRNNKALISVKDSGAGISRKDLPKIWERFYKSDASRGKDKRGTGLGLAIVKEVIQAHDERINVISTEGVGTEFIFSLTLSNNNNL